MVGMKWSQLSFYHHVPHSGLVPSGCCENLWPSSASFVGCVAASDRPPVVDCPEFSPYCFILSVVDKMNETQHEIRVFDFGICRNKQKKESSSLSSLFSLRQRGKPHWPPLVRPSYALLSKEWVHKRKGSGPAGEGKEKMVRKPMHGTQYNCRDEYVFGHSDSTENGNTTAAVPGLLPYPSTGWLAFWISTTMKWYTDFS